MSINLIFTAFVSDVDIVRRETMRPAYCIVHPKKLSPEIWNAEGAECPYFEERE